MDSDAYLPIAIFGAVIVAIAFITLYQTKKAGENLAALAQRLGLTLKTTGKFFKKHSLVGELRGKQAEVFSYTTGAGKSRRTWAAMAVTVGKTGGLTFSLERRVAFLDFFARAFRRNEVKTGDEIFDRQWLLKTNRPELMQAILLPELRQKLTSFLGSGATSPSFKLETYRVQYSEQGSFSSDKVCQRIATGADILCELADIVEVTAEMKNTTN
ncbi:MAG: hypothetical protein QM715_11210 [Nibricoccus sp.]